jgi:hypothetical protein
MLLAFITQMAAQNYVPMLHEGKIWNFTTATYPQPPNYSGDTSTVSFMLSGDTLINNKTYHILHQINCWEAGSDIENINAIAYLREDSINKQVFISHYDEELLLYDFSVEVGDTLFGEDYIFEDHIDMVVNQIDSSLINGYYRKHISFNVLTGTDWSSVWTEGIGATPLLNYIAGDTWYSKSLNCLFENGTLVYHGSSYETCCPGEMTGIPNANSLNNQIILFPNPAHDILTIEFSKTESSTIRIFDLSASMIYQKELPPGKSSINISQLSAGIYFAKITGKSKSSCTRFSIR